MSEFESLRVNKQTCDAEGCIAVATEEIEISVGHMGNIELSVCRDWKPKFVPERDLTKEKLQYSKLLVGRHDWSTARVRTNPRQEFDLND
jgi:hypothetical protein